MTAPSGPGAAPPGQARLAGFLARTQTAGNTINIVGLALLSWGVSTEGHRDPSGAHLAAVLLLIACAGAWVTWVVLRATPYARFGLGALVMMGAAGGALAPLAPLAITFVGVAALGAAAGWRLRAAVWAVGTSWVALFISVPASGHPTGVIWDGLAASLAGVVVGISRRQSVERATQATAVELEQARAELERARAEVLSERNRLAREIHDVLAHTLAALSVQLEALDAVAAEEKASSVVLYRLAQTKRLVREGLDEARHAVRALRDEPAPLVEELTKLCRERRARLVVSGTTRPVPAEVSVALYRVAQEALTNAMKHAPGALVDVEVVFGEETVSLSVDNAIATSERSPLTGTGAGYGLQGIRERVLLLGGHVDAGPAGHGWSVKAKVPA